MTTALDLREIIRSPDWCQDPFHVLRDLADQTSQNSAVARELVVRALEYRPAIDRTFHEILDQLAIQVGLYPYVENLEALSLRSALNHAAHRADGLMNDYVLHSSQSAIYERLLDGRSVILSAPTSFGKSLLIDAIIAAKEFGTVTIIVPTIALIEETRRRLTRFASTHNIITNAGQVLADRNIFVLTQERFIALADQLPDPDFFVIDEFYKLSLGGQGERATLLNRVFMELVQTKAQFYLLGPAIGQIPDRVMEKLDCDFIVEDFHTVAVELLFLKKRPSKIASLLELLLRKPGPTLVYCQSPASARRVVKELLEREAFEETTDEELHAAADWTSRNYHHEWLVSVALRHGVGIHHGRLPRALGRFMVRAFEEQKLSTIVCTSTLIEGVNTSARNVVIYDNKIERTRLDLFTFNNIRGRSGRMFKHFLGYVYVYEAPPEEELPFVDIPAFNPTEDTPTSLLLKMPYYDLPDAARRRLESVLAQDVVPREILEAHPSVEPEFMVAAALQLMKYGARELSRLAWHRRPTYEQVDATSVLIWGELGGSSAAKRGGIFSSKMMTFWIWELYKLRSVATFRQRMIANQIGRGESPDDAVETVLSFTRNWAAFNYPRYLMVLNDVLRCVLERRGMPSCDYISFASAIEHLFMPRSFSALEEYGLPTELSERLVDRQVFRAEDELGDVLAKLRGANLEGYASDMFEEKVFLDFQLGLGRGAAL